MFVCSLRVSESRRGAGAGSTWCSTLVNMSSGGLLSVSVVNAMSHEQFVVTFGNVVELCPDAAHRVGDKRPFADTRQLCEAFAHYLDSRTELERMSILCLHPDLAARLSSPLTAESSREQSAAGLHHASDEERDLIQHYNHCYRKKFGFPFIICARQNKVKSIIEGLRKRYNNHQLVEIENAINEVKKICQLRIFDIVQHCQPVF